MKKLTYLCSVISAISFLATEAVGEDDVDGIASDEDSTYEAGSDEGGSDEGAAGEEGETVSGGEGGEDGAPKAAGKSKEKFFHTLPVCRRLEGGTAEVMKPGHTEWTPVEEGKRYPLGSTYRTAGENARLTVRFGNDIDVIIKGEGSFSSLYQPLGGNTRTVNLIAGKVTVKLPRNLPEGVFTVSANGFKVVNPQGESRYTLKPTMDGEDISIRCVTGRLAVEGMHFKVVEMKAANEIKIRTSTDRLFTGIYGTRGDCMVQLDQGKVIVEDYGTGERKEVEKKLDWKLSPQTVVRIHRALPRIGSVMSVTIMTFDSAGELKNRCAFAEGLVAVNSGELGPTSKKDRSEIVKRAAEATDTVTTDADTTTEEAEGDSGDGSDSDSTSEDDELGL